MRSAKGYPVIIGGEKIQSATFYPTLQAAMQQSRELMKQQNDTFRFIQVGIGSDGICFVRNDEDRRLWNVHEHEPFWSEKEIEAHGKQPATLTVSYANTKEARMRLGWGYAKWVQEMFAEKFGIIFEGEGRVNKADNKIVWTCVIPAEAERALTQSYGCKIHRGNIRV